jgi:hypothetical protein
MPNMTRVVDWNGKDIPEGLRSLPPGRYVVEQVEEAPVLTPDEEEGIREAIRSLEAGEGRSQGQVRSALSAALER